MKHDVKDHFNHQSTNKPPRSLWSLSKPSGSIRIGSKYSRSEDNIGEEPQSKNLKTYSPKRIVTTVYTMYCSYYPFRWISLYLLHRLFVRKEYLVVFHSHGTRYTLTYWVICSPLITQGPLQKWTEHSIMCQVFFRITLSLSLSCSNMSNFLTNYGFRPLKTNSELSILLNLPTFAQGHCRGVINGKAGNHLP